MRNFRIPWFGGKEGARLQLRGEVYNLFNRVNLADVVTNIQDGNFGRSTFAFNPRTIQLGVRVEF
jgi:outer membrane receptor protein involved in Fe transport